MTPRTVIASPASARVDAVDPAPWRAASGGRIVHLGHSALVLQGTRGQFVITSDAFGLAPGGLQVTPAEFVRLRRELSADGTRIGGWRPALVEPVDLALSPVRIGERALAVLAHAIEAPRRIGALDPARQRADAPSLAWTALSGGGLTGPLLRLVGAGPGSTPAGDDVVAGVLAGLHASGRARAASALGAALLPLLPRTTASSAHYLAAAAAGRFAERVHLLVRGLRDEESARRAARAARDFGASSGTDLLAGVVAVARTALDIRRTA